MDAPAFTHLVYGQLVKQFGRDALHRFSAWDRLPEAERERWISAMAVVHKELFPHGRSECDQR